MLQMLPQGAASRASHPPTNEHRSAANKYVGKFLSSYANFSNILFIGTFLKHNKDVTLADTTLICREQVQGHRQKRKAHLQLNL